MLPQEFISYIQAKQASLEQQSVQIQQELVEALLEGEYDIALALSKQADSVEVDRKALSKIYIMFYKVI